jgi:hypothetical protein
VYRYTGLDLQSIRDGKIQRQILYWTTPPTPPRNSSPEMRRRFVETRKTEGDGEPGGTSEHD